MDQRAAKLLTVALFYKAWLESRVRFFASAGVLAAYCVSFVHDARNNFPPVLDPALPYTAYVWRGVYDGIDTLLFVVVALMLGLGGLQRERAAATAEFTLALPSTRIRLLLPRAAVALGEVAVLAIIPAIVVPWMSSRIGHAYPVADAVRFAGLFIATGAVWVSAGIFWSTVTTAELTGAVAAILTPAMYAAAVTGTGIRRWPVANIFYVMNGAHLPYVDSATRLFTGGVPWPAMFVLAMVAAALLAASAVALARSDF